MFSSLKQSLIYWDPNSNKNILNNPFKLLNLRKTFCKKIHVIIIVPVKFFRQIHMYFKAITLRFSLI